MYLFGFAKNYVLRSIIYVASPLVEIEKNITICHQSVGGNREICILKLPPALVKVLCSMVANYWEVIIIIGCIDTIALCQWGES